MSELHKYYFTIILNTLIPFSIGIDIVLIDKFSKMPYIENKEFYSKIFTDKEIEYCMKFNDPYPHFAGKFALKEASKLPQAKKPILSALISAERLKLRTFSFKFLFS